MTTKKSMKKDEQAVSPVIAVIMLIAITVVIAAVVAAFAYGIIGGVKKAPNTALVVQDAVENSKNITIIHHGGENILGAFEGGNWSKLEVRYQGAAFPATDAYLNGNSSALSASTGSVDFVPGDELRLYRSAGYSSGESITVVYTATGDVLQRVLVR